MIGSNSASSDCSSSGSSSSIPSSSNSGSSQSPSSSASSGEASSSSNSSSASSGDSSAASDFSEGFAGSAAAASSGGVSASGDSLSLWCDVSASGCSAFLSGGSGSPGGADSSFSGGFLFSSGLGFSGAANSCATAEFSRSAKIESTCAKISSAVVWSFFCSESGRLFSLIPFIPPARARFPVPKWSEYDHRTAHSILFFRFSDS